MNTIELKIKGMNCGSCVSSAIHALQRAPGVNAINVDLARSTARVSSNAQAAPAMLAVLAVAGHGVESLNIGAGVKTEHVHHGDVPTGITYKSGGCCHW